MEERVNFRRTISAVALAIITYIFSGLLCYRGGLYTDEWICVFFVDTIFLMCFVYELESERLAKLLSNNINTNFSRVVVAYFFVFVITFLISYAPVYFKPVMILPVIICSVSNETVGIIIGMFLNILLSLTVGGDYNELLAYSILIIFGAIITKALTEGNSVLYAYILLFTLNILIPSLFYYWNSKEMDGFVILKSAIDGVITIVVAVICSRYIVSETQNEIENVYYDIVSDDYSLVKEVRAYSEQEYKHAKKVSGICAKCAAIANLDVTLCLVSGFYYRLGKWQGEPHIYNGIVKAKDYCFPEKVIDILSEYYGEEKDLSTPESALVQMVDAVMIKLEYLKDDVSNSQWNNEIIVYQILNEYSSKGLYDKSGLSMNQFLKIREYLVKEESL